MGADNKGRQHIQGQQQMPCEGPRIKTDYSRLHLCPTRIRQCCKILMAWRKKRRCLLGASRQFASHGICWIKVAFAIDSAIRLATYSRGEEAGRTAPTCERKLFAFCTATGKICAFQTLVL